MDIFVYFSPSLATLPPSAGPILLIGMMALKEMNRDLCIAEDFYAQKCLWKLEGIGDFHHRMG
jgi:hypothetical protein